MISESFRSGNFRIAYGPSDDCVRDFFVPALSRCIRFDCLIGSFFAFSLSDVAEGISRLAGNRGAMRLLTGFPLDEADVGAMRKKQETSDALIGKIMPLFDREDPMIRRNLEILAWMTAEQILQIRFLLPRKSMKISSSKDSGRGIFPVTGVFTDGDGLKVAQQGWPNDPERFFVFQSWDAGAPYLEAIQRHFDNLWEGGEPDWLTLPLPPVLKDRLIQLKPLKSPLQDGPGNLPIGRPQIDPALKEKLFFQFLRDIQNFPGDPQHPSASELEGVLTGSEMLKACWEKHSEIQGAWILGWQGKRIPVTFQQEIFRRHPETLRLLSHDEPLLHSLLQGVPPLKVPEACQVPLIRFSVDAPVPLAAYYDLGANEARNVKTLADLASAADARMRANGPSSVAESRAREHFNTVVRNQRKARAHHRQSIQRATLRKLEEKGRKILERLALCDIARSAHATLFDQNLIAAGFDEQTVLRQGEKSPALAELISVIHAGGLKPDIADPFRADVDGKPEKKIRVLEDALLKEAHDLLRTMAELKGKTTEDAGAPTVEAKLFYKRSQRDKQPLMLAIAPSKKERFTRYLPFYTLTAAAEKFGGGDAKEEGWIEVNPDHKPKKTMFVVRIMARSMEPILEEDSLGVFDSSVPDAADGLILMVRSGKIDDPDGITIRRCHFSGRTETGKTFRYRELRMEPENPEYKTIVLKNVASGDFKIVGRYVSGI